MPRGFLYKTRCIAKYHAEQYDEICLNIGDIIYVVRYDDPEDVVRVKLVSELFKFHVYANLIVEMRLGVRL